MYAVDKEIFVIIALFVELSFVTGYLLNKGAALQAENGGVYPVSLENRLKGLSYACAGLVIHSFGAYLGLAAVRFISNGAAGHRDEKSSFCSDLFSRAEPSSSACCGHRSRLQRPARTSGVPNTFVSLCARRL